MADIENSIVYSPEIKSTLNSKINDASFNHRNWGDDDLNKVRKEIRDFYKNEQKGVCSFCKQNLSLVSAMNCTVEHIVPKSLHLEYIFTEKNLCVICADCNHIKREQETLCEIPQTLKDSKSRKQYPRSSNAFKIIHPHFDTYEDHILISNGFYIDKTKKGHFTIGACRLNRKLYEFDKDETLQEAKASEMMNEFLDEDDFFRRRKKLEELKKYLNKK
tara:strand:+ start:428 stop:1081 length:654 start_codon:yes stop_codon:yes gene_type:complete